MKLRWLIVATTLAFLYLLSVYGAYQIQLINFQQAITSVVVGVPLTILTAFIGWSINRESQKIKKKEERKSIHDKKILGVFKNLVNVAALHINHHTIEIKTHSGDYHWHGMEALEYFKWTEQHLQSYSKIWQIWENARSLVKKHNELGPSIHAFVEQTIKKKMLLKYSSLIGRKINESNLKDCYILENVMDLVYDSVSYLREGRRFTDSLRLNVVQRNDLWRLENSRLFIQSSRKDDVNDEYFKSTINELANEAQKQITPLNDIYMQVYEKFKLFSDELKELMRRIDLGEPLQGKCNICERF